MEYFVVKTPAGVLPSTSNSRLFLKAQNKLIKNPQYQKRLQICGLYFSDVKRKIKVPAKYGFIFAIFAERKRAYDAHNLTKPLGDLFQALQIVENDKWLEIFCLKDWQKRQKLDVYHIMLFQTKRAFLSFINRIRSQNLQVFLQQTAKS